jgi:hypothetical protein
MESGELSREGMGGGGGGTKAGGKGRWAGGRCVGVVLLLPVYDRVSAEHQGEL